MKAEELRIGNLVYAETGLPSLEVHTVMAGDIHDIDSGRAKVEPIPLTEEWLLNLGFKLHSRHSYHNYILENGFCVSIWMEDKPCAGFEEKGICYWGENYISIKHVHQLQNLYFALYGQEIVIKDGI